jgi:hypothetical protein
MLLLFIGGAGARKPAWVSPNGNCLFNALSTAIVANESLANEFRVAYEHALKCQIFDNFMRLSTEKQD